EEFTSYQTFDGKKQKKPHDFISLCAILDYHFGVGSHKLIDKKTLEIERSRKTGILRRFSDKEGLLGTFRAQDFSIIPSSSFAKRLHNHIKYPNRRVIAAEESIPFILNNKDMLAKFVTDADPMIRPGEEVLIVDQNDVFLNFGTSILSAQEMLDFERGIAVQVRR
ncbi:PUA domain-containing protein, partial [Candidatus Hodarchaeum mangrovi]